ncbi:uncharacterized protein K444DRAFT_649127 [Hyaloscypha bicolor E]|uniref:MFS general substrate transporter n=1 Tax=Hyaloscypha bicolor E TaxID=1095630 RepID=A0A2J6TV69_9HELO|nr:uncharacterized protein K444DRAFT_649127 [Hyaloscypha bicolor E]PMD66934.1 hypothetical protein K444DRAFT_649127 [Hyaloscypha bicolor E]
MMEEMKQDPEENQQVVGLGETWLESPSVEVASYYEESLALDRTILWKRDLIEGLVAGINMPSNGYNVCLSVFYILFVLAEIPFNFLQEENKFKPAYLLGAQMFCFAAGTLSIATYQTKKEVGLRFSFVFNFALALPPFLGLLTYAIENLDSNLSLLVGVGPSSWRAL